MMKLEVGYMPVSRVFEARCELDVDGVVSKGSSRHIDPQQAAVTSVNQAMNRAAARLHAGIQVDINATWSWKEPT